MTLKTSHFTQALINLEDAAPDVLFEKLPSATVPFWPQVRMTLAYAMSETEFTSVAVGGGVSGAAALKRAALAFLPFHRDARGLRGVRDLLFLVGGSTTYGTQAGERNWLVGDYADAFPSDSAILQWRPTASTRQAFPATRSLDALRARAEVRNRLFARPPIDGAVRLLTTEFARLLSAGLNETRLDSIVAETVYAVNLRQWLDREVETVLDHLRPRTVLLEDAVDGRWATMIALMKASGVHVVEPQHGWIGPSHGAYNFGAAMRRPELAVALPDELLTFGRYWSRGLRHVGAITPIGKPHLEKMARSIPAVEDRPREVLVVSSVGEPEQAAEFVLALADALPDGWLVRFRPHPSERPVVTQRYPTLAGSATVALDERADVYESLASARIVVGVASTVLFEAVAMGCRVFVRDTSYVPYIVGDLFGASVSGADGLARIARAASERRSSERGFGVDSAELWEPNAVANFRSWAERRSAVSTRSTARRSDHPDTST